MTYLIQATGRRKAAVTQKLVLSDPRIYSWCFWALQAPVSVYVELVDYNEEFGKRTNPQSQPTEFFPGLLSGPLFPLLSLVTLTSLCKSRWMYSFAPAKLVKFKFENNFDNFQYICQIHNEQKAQFVLCNIDSRRFYRPSNK